MIQLGQLQQRTIVRLTQNGAYINAADGGDQDILLPQNQLTPDMAVGDELNVFIYKDSEDRLIATLKTPKLTAGSLAVLEVVELTKVGAFLDVGLEKDLLLPFKEQTGPIKKGGKYLVSMYVDNSGRLCATMKIYGMLSAASPYKAKDRVQGLVTGISPEWGCFVAVDDKYHGLIYTKELYGQLELGDRIDARVKKVRPDGKLELSMREPAYKEIEGDARVIFERLKANNGALPLNDNSAPEDIKAALGMSKGAFKRAVGRLLKEGAIKITDSGIESSWK